VKFEDQILFRKEELNNWGGANDRSIFECRCSERNKSFLTMVWSTQRVLEALFF
jgi:hypothetical protein